MGSELFGALAGGTIVGAALFRGSAPMQAVSPLPNRPLNTGKVRCAAGGSKPVCAAAGILLAPVDTPTALIKATCSTASLLVLGAKGKAFL